MPNDQLWASSELCPCHQGPPPAPKPQTSQTSSSSPQASACSASSAWLPLAHHRPTLESSSSPRGPRPPGGPGIRPGVSSAGRKSGRGGGSRTLIGHTLPASALQGPSRPLLGPASLHSCPHCLPALPQALSRGNGAPAADPASPGSGSTAPREHRAPSPASPLPGCLPAVKPWHRPSCRINGSTPLSARH